MLLRSLIASGIVLWMVGCSSDTCTSDCGVCATDPTAAGCASDATSGETGVPSATPTASDAVPGASNGTGTNGAATNPGGNADPANTDSSSTNATQSGANGSETPGAAGSSDGQPATSPVGSTGSSPTDATGAGQTPAPPSPSSSADSSGADSSSGDSSSAPGSSSAGSSETPSTDSNSSTAPEPTSVDPAPTPPPAEDPTSDASSRLRAVPVGSTDAKLGYWEYLPQDYGDQPLPLLVFTHGAGWAGDGSEATLNATLNEKDWPLINLMRDDRWPNSRPFIVLAPQNPTSACFASADIDAFYHYAVGHYNVDPKRIYHVGQSCGAFGTVSYLADHLDEFVTAAVVISTLSNTAFADAGCDLGRVSIWALHNEFDPVTDKSATPSIDLITNLLACTPTPDAKLTVYKGVMEHDAWTKTFDLSAGNDVFSWLLEHTHP